MIITVNRSNFDNITIDNETYGKVKCVDDSTKLPDIGVDYLYLQWGDEIWYEKYWVDLNNHVQEFTEDQLSYLEDLVTNWEQPLGQEGNPTVEQAKNSKLAELSGKFNSSVKSISSAYPAEMVSWRDQENEARGYKADDSIDTPILNTLIDARGLDETVDDLATKVIANADYYKTSYYPLLGKYQSLSKQADAAETKDDLAAILW